jgi:hypothetical protein
MVSVCGSKCFATEQRLVSTSPRSALKDIELTPLRGKRAAIVFDMIQDEGGGSMEGGTPQDGLHADRI